jgi:hypothetical protein
MGVAWRIDDNLGVPQDGGCVKQDRNVMLMIHTQCLSLAASNHFGLLECGHEA